MDRQDSVVLPYEFDSSGTPALIVRGVLGLLFLVVVPGILYSLVVSRSVAAAAQLLIVGGVVVYFGRLFLRNLETARGTITQGVVVVQPGSLYGIRLAGPAGSRCRSSSRCGWSAFPPPWRLGADTTSGCD